MVTKICSKCKIEYDINEFYNSKRGSYGKSYLCKICDKKRQYNISDASKEKRKETRKLYRINNREKLNKYNREWRNNNEKFKEHRKECDHNNRVENPYKFWAWDTIQGHKGKKGHEVNITPIELENLVRNARNCPICGIELVIGVGKGKHTMKSPSLDRIENTKVLNMNNVWIICRRCNIIKHDMSMKTFVEYCKNVVDKFGN